MKTIQTTWSNVFPSTNQPHRTSRSRKANYTGFIFFMSILLIAFSACTNPLDNGTQAATTPADGPVIQAPTPDLLQAAKNRAVQLLAGMS
ncbi:MAG TPA: hypothetical protein VH164_04885, partial [Ktedonobacteraceae bacterium]|nr:hypothetical protein [Ktedonobacteraceae bacterium]